MHGYAPVQSPTWPPQKNSSHNVPPVQRVAILVGTSTTWLRNILAGEIAPTRTHGRWQIFVEARGMEERLDLPRGWHGNGFIARVGSERIARELRAKRLPVINVSGSS